MIETLTATNGVDPEAPKRVYVGGRPPKFKTVEAMQEAINEYFNRTLGNVRTYHDKNGNKTITEPAPLPVTMSGLANSLGLDRMSLLNYEKREINGEKKFFSTIRAARRIVEEFAEGKLYVPGIANGASFALRNNHEGWEDRKKVDENVNGNIFVKNTDYKNADPEVPEGVEVQPL